MAPQIECIIRKKLVWTLILLLMACSSHRTRGCKGCDEIDVYYDTLSNTFADVKCSIDKYLALEKAKGKRIRYYYLPSFKKEQVIEEFWDGDFAIIRRIIPRIRSVFDENQERWSGSFLSNERCEKVDTVVVFDIDTLFVGTLDTSDTFYKIDFCSLRSAIRNYINCDCKLLAFDGTVNLLQIDRFNCETKTIEWWFIDYDNKTYEQIENHYKKFLFNDSSL